MAAEHHERADGLVASVHRSHDRVAFSHSPDDRREDVPIGDLERSIATCDLPQQPLAHIPQIGAR